MATLILGTIGSIFGGRIGGAIGALVGQQADRAIFGSPTRKGPRLKDLSVQTSSYGAPVPRYYGRMRVAGSVIWATDLKESKDRKGGGKGKSKVVTYSYSASFAVALASRPIAGIGRIWADGTLLRGAAGDLKAGGALRIHAGHADQPVDPLLAAAEGTGRCPAFRDLAYLVFEDLALADFGNRIPSLTVEVFADPDAIGLEALLADAAPGIVVEPLGMTLAGFGHEGGDAAALIEAIGEIVPLSCVAGADSLTIRRAGGGPDPALLPEPLAVAARDDDPARPALELTLAPSPEQRDVAVRYYDIDRDYQPGVQRARGRSHRGEAVTIEFPAALAAPQALALADDIAVRREAARHGATCRIASADGRFFPGRLVRVPGEAGHWLVETWEMDGKGIELKLRRIRPASPSATPLSDPGRAVVPADLIPGATLLEAFELPWDGVGNPSDARIFAAVSSSTAGWTGAALYAVRPDGSLDPLGGSGRRRATIGSALTALGEAPGAPLDLRNRVEVELAAADFALADAGATQLAMGANRALLGNEIIQFARAEPLGSGRWRLHGLLRGRGGTEWAIAGHGAGDRFVLLDEALVTLDPATIGDPVHTGIAALGIADEAPVVAAIGTPGAALLPLSPVHGRTAATSSQGLLLTWVRRARGAWLWRDAVDAPLVEQGESYVVTLGDGAAQVAQWIVGEPKLALDATTVTALRAQAGGARFIVRQRGDHGLSAPLPLGHLA